jgi:hypothetical protein
LIIGVRLSLVSVIENLQSFSTENSNEMSITDRKRVRPKLSGAALPRPLQLLFWHFQD